MGAEHESALVRLADVEVSGTVGQNDIEHRLDAFAHEGLQHVALDRHLSPAIAASRDECPATARHIVSAAMCPRVVSTAVTRAPSRAMPVTSQSSMMSTPASDAARAYPQATASWRTVPPRRCRNPPSTG